jgi:hypothetical protein
MQRRATQALGLGLCTAWALCAPAADSTPPPAPLTDLVRIEDLVQAPAVSIANGVLTAKVYLPDAERGFYRGSRFDWAGVIGSLTLRGHDFYVPWFRGMSPSVRDFEFRDGAAIASANTAATGPVEEFNGEGGALGYADAPAGGLFLKIGVGVLRRPDATAFSPFQRYPIVDPGKRTTTVRKDRVQFTHAAADKASGYGYQYTKVVRLVAKQPVMLLEHVLKNTGSKPIATTVYNHNFLNIDGAGTRGGLELTTRFAIAAEPAPDAQLAQVVGTQVVYRASPGIGQRVSMRMQGFGTMPADNDFHIVDRSSGTGLRISADRPLDRVVLWSIGPVMSIEPFVRMTIEPGKAFRWSSRYEFEAGTPK